MTKQSPIGQLTQNELDYLKAEILAQLQNSTFLEDAIMTLMSEPKYPENIPEAEEIGTGDLEAYFRPRLSADLRTRFSPTLYTR